MLFDTALKGFDSAFGARAIYPVNPALIIAFLTKSTLQHLHVRFVRNNVGFFKQDVNFAGEGFGADSRVGDGFVFGAADDAAIFNRQFSLLIGAHIDANHNGPLFCVHQQGRARGGFTGIASMQDQGFGEQQNVF